MSRLNQKEIQFLRKAGVPDGFHESRLEGGANNQVYCIDAGESSYLLKVYFQHPDDRRNRLAAEFSFCACAWNNGARWTPKPLMADTESNCGLYEFISGRALDSSEITWPRVEESLAFFKEINGFREKSDAQQLPIASEACFSLSEHLACVGNRVDRLHLMEGRSDPERRALKFVQEELSPAWQKTRENVVAGAQAHKIGMDDRINHDNRCISPSDFGFHNAILTPQDRLRFIDFEYAGWDDPAKTICDFFCQPRLRVPRAFYPDFAKVVVSALSMPLDVLVRAALLLPVYRIKWCCIMLNDFLPVDSRRRTFALSPGQLEKGQAAQLEKARSTLGELRADAGAKR